MNLSTEQQAAVEAFEAAIVDGRSQLVIAGHAGTGKTTVIKSLVGILDFSHNFAVCTPTGKAAHVLRTKGVDATTLHSLLYYPRTSDKRLLAGTKSEPVKMEFVDNGEQMPDVVIVDEASMLDVRMVEDLRARVRFVCYVGDHGQLEPVGEDPGLMKAPDIRLETIHRQAKGSPIISFAHSVRKGRAPMTTGDAARVVLKAPQDLPGYDVILCAKNKTRVRLNAWMRRKRGFAGRLPMPGEQVICLRNNKQRKVFNGMTGVVLDVNEQRNLISVDTDDGTRHNVPFVPEQFGMEKTLQDPKFYRKHAPTLWDFGYALTAHKAQGSEWGTVAVYDEVPSNWAVDRWRYTAATRASERLLWITA